MHLRSSRLTYKSIPEYIRSDLTPIPNLVAESACYWQVTVSNFDDASDTAQAWFNALVFVRAEAGQRGVETHLLHATNVDGHSDGSQFAREVGIYAE